MPLSQPQQRILKDWMRSKGIVRCPACGDARWRVARAGYAGALLEPGEPDLGEDKGW